jgi:hypothetical protein
MIEFFSWMKLEGRSSKPWLMFGKGPTFERHREVPDLDEKFLTVGLNHICRQRNVLLTNMIDANVLGEVAGIEGKTKFIIMPWQPHVNFQPTKKTLDKFVEESPVLQQMEKEERLLWYNCSTGNKPRPDSPGVGVSWFSAEAVVCMLAMAGVKVLRTLGVDGGNKYATSFKDIAPFRGGHTTFDKQTEPIRATVKQFGVDYSPLF